MARKPEAQLIKQIRDAIVEIGFVDGVPMPFTSVDRVDFQWNEQRGLAQGYSNARNSGFGIGYLESKDADVIDVTVVECSLELYNRIEKAWKEDERVDIIVTFNNSKDRIVFNNSQLTTAPAQTAIGTGRDTIQFHLVGCSFDVDRNFS